jgi:hypothetical protein
MNKVDKYDPYYLKIDQRWDNIKRLEFREKWRADSTLADQPFPGTSMPQPRISTHLWEDNLGTDWPVGRHIIEVKAEDRYGRTFTSYHPMRVVSAED